MQPLAQPVAAWAGGLCSLPFEHGLEARDLVLTALLPSRAGGEWWGLLGSQGEGSESPVLPRRSPLGLHAQSSGSACAHHLALALFQSCNPKPECSPAGERCSSLKKWPKGIWR